MWCLLAQLRLDDRRRRRPADTGNRRPPAPSRRRGGLPLAKTPARKTKQTTKPRRPRRTHEECFATGHLFAPSVNAERLGRSRGTINRLLRASFVVVVASWFSSRRSKSTPCLTVEGYRTVARPREGLAAARVDCSTR